MDMNGDIWTHEGVLLNALREVSGKWARRYKVERGNFHVHLISRNCAQENSVGPKTVLGL